MSNSQTNEVNFFDFNPTQIALPFRSSLAQRIKSPANKEEVQFVQSLVSTFLLKVHLLKMTSNSKQNAKETNEKKTKKTKQRMETQKTQTEIQKKHAETAKFGQQNELVLENIELHGKLTQFQLNDIKTMRMIQELYLTNETLKTQNCAHFRK